MRNANYWQMLRENPEYTKLWLAQVISLTGDWFNTVVLSGIVAAYSGGSGIAIGFFLMLRLLAPFVVGPFAGVLLDRFNRKHMLFWSNALRALIVPLYLLATGPETLWIVYAVTAAQFALSAIFEPGQSAIIPALVKPEHIVEGNTLMSVTWSVMLAFGAIIGGVFAFIFGTTAALLADAVTFAIAAAFIAWVNYDPARGRKLVKSVSDLAAGTNDEDTSIWEGLRYVRNTPQMMMALFVKFAQSLGNIDTLLTVYATQLFVIGSQGEVSLGILYSALGVGALIGPLTTNRFNDGSPFQMRRLISIGFVMVAFSWPLLGFATSLFLVAAAIFLRSMGTSINWTYSNVIIQKSAPDSKLGRMFAFDMAGFQIGSSLSFLVHGVIIDWLGVESIGMIVWGTMVVSIVASAIYWWGVPRLEAYEKAQGINKREPLVGAAD